MRMEMTELHKDFGTFANSVIVAEKELDKLESKFKSNMSGKDFIKILSQVRALQKMDLKAEVDHVRKIEKETIERTLDDMTSCYSASEDFQRLLKYEVLPRHSGRQREQLDK